MNFIETWKIKKISRKLRTFFSTLADFFRFFKHQKQFSGKKYSTSAF